MLMMILFTDLKERDKKFLKLGLILVKKFNTKSKFGFVNVTYLWHFVPWTALIKRKFFLCLFVVDK